MCPLALTGVKKRVKVPCQAKVLHCIKRNTAHNHQEACQRFIGRKIKQDSLAF